MPTDFARGGSIEEEEERKVAGGRGGGELDIFNFSLIFSLFLTATADNPGSDNVCRP
jgi:hypothetical protein